MSLRPSPPVSLRENAWAAAAVGLRAASRLAAAATFRTDEIALELISRLRRLLDSRGESKTGKQSTGPTTEARSERIIAACIAAQIFEFAGMRARAAGRKGFQPK